MHRKRIRQEIEVFMVIYNDVSLQRNIDFLLLKNIRFYSKIKVPKFS
jgi:hypothetical protein